MRPHDKLFTAVNYAIVPRYTPPGCLPPRRYSFRFAMAATDREVLVALFLSTGGTSWERNDNWNTTAELSTWYGIKVDGQGRVVQLRLGGNNLRGTFAVFLERTILSDDGLPLRFIDLKPFRRKRLEPTAS